MLKVFCDFDGTVSKGDVGDAFFRRFSGEEALELVRRWEVGEMNSRDLYLAMLRSFRASPEEVEEFIAEQEIDPSFREFAGFCAREEIPLAILSDGMDLYIRPLLERNGLAGL
ncbi:MAG TPA: phosphoserine phosphatase, partial [Bacteroidetes bacterium]|nr:phosphoserine phosphatase [Bacteroidota bacterium]